MQDIKNTENLHEMHRENMRKRFLSENLKSFRDHEILEMMLYYTIPIKDTNPAAHRLINKFGSFRSVLDADIKDLIQVDGIGEKSAVMIKFFAAVAKKYFSEQVSQKNEVLTYEGIGERLVIEFSGLSTECIYAFFFDSSLSLCDQGMIHIGDINTVGFSPRKLAERIVSSGASYIILAHNHPHGLPIASSNDLHSTGSIKSFLAQINVTLIDHFIVAGKHYSSLYKEDCISYLSKMK